MKTDTTVSFYSVGCILVKENSHYFVNFGRIANVSATSTCSQCHVTKFIRCDRTCQRSITIINKEKSFTSYSSWLSQYFLLNFYLKESSQRDLSEHVKTSIIKKWHLFWWLIQLYLNSMITQLLIDVIDHQFFVTSGYMQLWFTVQNSILVISWSMYISNFSTCIVISVIIIVMKRTWIGANPQYKNRVDFHTWGGGGT